MTTPHKHADLIIAWAKGAAIQYQSDDPGDSGWYDYSEGIGPSWREDMNYRIKPEKKWVRVSLVTPDITYTVNNSESEKNIELDRNFKRWITDRIYYE